jgi:predicted TIM-barrel fold metal-dependent hydrolase
MIIDFHNHVWPDTIAPKALGGNIPGMQLFGDGTVSGLAAAQDAAGIDRSVCLAVANTAAQLGPANRFVGSIDRSRFIPFGSVHPDAGPEANLAHLRDNQVQGVKLHPIFQGYRLDDPRLMETLAALEGEFCVIVHLGDGGGADGSSCTPAMAARVARTFPKLTLVACHFGGYHRLEESAAELSGLHLLFDTSWPPTLAELDPDLVRETIRRHGAEQVLFASDWPTADPAAEIAAVRSLGLGEDELALILGGNACRVLGLDPSGSRPDRGT